MKGFHIIFILLLFSKYVFAQEREFKENPLERAKFESEIILDPSTGSIPTDRLLSARKNIQNKFKFGSYITNFDWSEMGPSNAGGRTRALVFDPNDANHKRVWAGGVAGGLWYNNDITDAAQQWQKIDDFWANLAISCITFDPISPQKMYVGTGEGWQNIDAVRGAGIWHSANNGTTWQQLPETATNSDFNYVQDIVVNANGKVFAATQNGIYASSDNGNKWHKIFTPSVGSVFVADLEIASDQTIFAAFGKITSSGSGVFKSSDEGLSWTNITPDISGARTELALAPSTSGNAQVIYAVSTYGDEPPNTGKIKWFKKSVDAGSTWTNIVAPNFTSSQGWYNLILAVHPTNPNLVIAGGTNLAKTTDGGANWTMLSYGIPYPDQHAIVFNESNPDQVIIGNDGGVFFSENYGNIGPASTTNPTFKRCTKGYNVAQFYSVAVKNIAGSGYAIGGTQDNGSQKINPAIFTQGTGIDVAIFSGDGYVCFIDRDNPNVQIISGIRNVYELHNQNGDFSESIVIDGDKGKFLNPATYNDKINIFYSYSDTTATTTRLSRVTDVGGRTLLGSMTINVKMDITFMKAGKTDHTIFIGCKGGKIYKITNAGIAGQSFTQIDNSFLPSGNTTISCIDIGATENNLLVTFSNYGIASVWLTTDGGATWLNKDQATNGLEDIPVRAAVFYPLDRKQVFLATELGIWRATDITGSNPNWQPTNVGLANVRCDGLVYRSADHTLAVGTHGRGIYMTTVPLPPNCKSQLVLQNPNTLSNTTIESFDWINAKTNNVIDANQKINYSAGKYILLEPNFEAKQGSTFQAQIAGCAEN
jgi:photosystem II stability/assembly factor-like uncharacterized protein